MRNVMSTALGVGIGHAVSHTLMSAMSPAEQQQAVQEAQTSVPQGCNFQLETFQKCLDRSSDPSQCQWIYEDLMTCKNSNAQAY
jgi:membrane protease subunit (stomatin/prohibitin family)